MSQVFVLDGGFSNELNKRTSFDVHQDPLWTAKAIFTEPHAIEATHLVYLKAGADIIETSTYQATLKGFQEHLLLDEDSGISLLKKAVTLAKNAISSFSAGESSEGRDVPLLAGSIGPYGASICDGSEYTGSYIDTVTKEVLIETHMPRLRTLVEEGVDLIAFETIPALKEAEILMELLKEHFPSTKAWVTFSVRLNDENRSSLETAYGDSIISAYESLSKYSQLWGFGLNCCPPDDVILFLKEFKKLWPSETRNIKLIVYPNTGQKWISGTGWVTDPTIKTIDNYTTDWIHLGANVIGGCCQVGPDEIKKIRCHVDDWNKSL